MKKRIIAGILAVVILTAAVIIINVSTSQIEIYGQRMDTSARRLILSGDEIGSLEELKENLKKLPRLRYADLGSFRVYAPSADELRAAFPDVTFRFTTYMDVYGKDFDTDITSMDLSGIEVTETAELLERLRYFPALASITFDSNNTLPGAEKDKLTDAHPAIAFNVVSTRVIYGTEFRDDAAELDFSAATVGDPEELNEMLRFFPALKTVTFGDKNVLPSEVLDEISGEYSDIKFNVVTTYDVCGVTVREDAREIDLTNALFDDDNITEPLIDALKHFPLLTRVSLGKDRIVTLDERKELCEAYPDIEFNAVVMREIYGMSVRDDITSLDLSGIKTDDELYGMLLWFPSLTSVTMNNVRMTQYKQLELSRLFPEIKFDFDVIIAGKKLDSLSEKIDLSGREITDLNEIRRAIQLFPNLNYLDMSDCGISNEEMAEFRSEYEGSVKIVWRLHMGQWSLKTDAVAFSVLIYNYEHTRLTSADIQVLKYCTDLRALDIGHQAVTDISVIGDYLPELRILILADNRVSDLTPLSKLKHLHYLEFFVNRVSDLSPLAECRELVDLNISYNYRISDITPLLDLPLLERLWLESCPISDEKVDILRERYPNSKIIKYGKGSVDQGWRSHPRYRAMIEMYHKKNFISELFSRYDGKTESLLTEPLR